MARFRKLHKILSALLVFTMLLGSVPAYAGESIVIGTDGTVTPDTYSDMTYAGVSGNSTSQALGSNVSSIKTADGGVAGTVYGIFANGSNAVTASSIAGGIAVNSTGGDAYGIGLLGSGGSQIDGVSEIKVAGNNAYGIYTNGSASSFYSPITITGNGTEAITATAAGGNAYSIYAEGQGTTKVNHNNFVF